MRIVGRFIFCIAGLVAATAGAAQAAETCPFISAQQLAGAMPAIKWSLISNQDGRGCIYRSGADTMMLSVFRNPTADRAKELYATLTGTLAARMPVAPVSGIGDATQAGTTTAQAARPEASVMALSGEYILSISVYRTGRPADDAVLKPLIEIARLAIGNVGKTSVKFGACEWLTPEDADGFLDRSTMTLQRTGAGSCMIFDGAANTLMVAVIAIARDTVRGMMRRNGGCKVVLLPELGNEAFAEHSCSSGNTNRVNIYVWKNGRQASIAFAPVKPHPESGSVDRLKAVASRVYGKM